MRRVGASADSVPTQLHERLQERRAELKETVLIRAWAVSDPTEISDPTYTEGLRTAIEAAIDYALDCIQSSERNLPPIPAALLVQARVAARSGVGLDTVLRRYLAGYGLLGDLLAEEAETIGVGSAALKGLQRRQTYLFDRLIAAVSEEHGREGPGQVQTSEKRKLQVVRRLLDGELVDAGEIAYDFETSHVAMVTMGAGLSGSFAEMAAPLDRRLLTVRPDEETTWAWLGGKSTVDYAELESLASRLMPESARLAIGEPGEGIAGWRVTHLQAKAALPIALRGGHRAVLYRDVALLASIAQDELLASFLRQLYLEPLRKGRDRGACFRDTLRAYFASGRNSASTAVRLRVTRQTVNNRLRAIEEAIGRSLDDCGSELEIALRLEDA